MARRKKPATPKPMTDGEAFEMLAEATRLIRWWEKTVPKKKFNGISLEEFKKAFQPCLDIRAEEARLDCEMERLRKLLGEEDPNRPSRH